VSKNEYVQEIGRAGRANESVKSYIIYLEPTEENIPSTLLKREIEISNLTKMLDDLANDYSDCYRKLNNRLDSKDDLIDNLMDLKKELSRCLVVKK
jgi:superfamily II DNA helicase RecQ